MDTNLFSIFTIPLNILDIPYFVTGSVAGIVYGEPRLTHDVDLVLSPPRNQLGAYCKAFPIEQFYCPPPDIIETELQRRSRGHFNLIHHNTGFKADIYLSSDDLHRWAFTKRRSIALNDSYLWVAPPEYVIIRKLEYYRERESQKHLRDITAITMVSAGQLDSSWLTRQINKRSLQAQWSLALKAAEQL